MRHHFQDDTRGFGVSAPFWDYVFRHRLVRIAQVSRPAGQCSARFEVPAARRENPMDL